MSLELIESAELSDLGLKRKNNEDACLRLPKRGVYCVADGMGGVVGGDLASKTIIDNVQEAFANARPEQCGTLASTAHLLGAAVNKASKWIKDFADEKVIGQMGSTLVGLVFDPRNPSRAVVLHAGDSRLYRWRAGRLEQLTADHTAAAALSATLGRDPASFPARFHNELARAVGLKESVELEESSLEARTGDVFMLCSDGLPRMVPDQDIGQIFARAEKMDLPTLARALIQKANEAGGKDNVTVVVLRVGDISRFAHLKTELDDVTTMAPPVVAYERDATAHTDGDVHSPPTPDTVRDDLAYTQLRATAPAPSPQKPPPVPPTPPPPAPPKEIPPSPKSRSRRRGPVIVGALVVLAAGILAVLNLPNKHALPPAPSPVTNNPPPPPPATNVVARVTNPPVVETNVAVQSTNPPAPVTNIVKPLPPTTGSLAISSIQEKVDVYKDGQKVGQTPYEANGLPAGSLTYQLGNLLSTSMVTMTIVAGETNTTNVNLTPRTGTFVVSSDPTNAEIWMGGNQVGHTPFSSKWNAGDVKLTLKYPPLEETQVTLKVEAETAKTINVPFSYGGVEIKSVPPGADVLFDGKLAGTTPLRTNLLAPGSVAFELRLTNYEPFAATVQVPKDRSIAETNIALKLIPVVAVVPVKPPVKEDKPVEPPPKLAGTGQVSTNLDRVVWTNRFGMAFARMPENGFWIETARVTPEQFKMVDGGNDQSTPTVTFDKAKSFAANLTTKLDKNNEFPPGCETWHFAIPTSEQWDMADNVKSLGLEVEEHYEWCLTGAGPGQEVCFVRYWATRKQYEAGEPEPLQEFSTKEYALRLVLAPPSK